MLWRGASTGLYRPADGRLLGEHDRLLVGIVGTIGAVSPRRDAPAAPQPVRKAISQPAERELHHAG